MALNLQRNSRLFVSTVDTGFSVDNTWEIPMQEGFSFSQANETQDIEVNEAGVAPTRGGKTFNTSLSPADWSFASYVRPISNTVTHAYQDIEPTSEYASNTIVVLSAGTYDFNIDLDNAGSPTNISVDLLVNTTAAGLLARINTALQTAGVAVTASLSNTGHLRFTKNVVGAGAVDITSGSSDLIAALEDSATIGVAVDGLATTGTSCIESILWQGLTNKGGFSSPGRFDIDFANSEAHELTKLYLFFKIDNVWYKLSDAQVNQAEIDFSIDGIGMITWTGQATKLEEADGTTVVHPDVDTPDFTQIDQNASYLKNKLSTVRLSELDPADQSIVNTYNIALTGGTITINNNITYLTPDTLSIVDQPIGSFTGTRSVTGNLTCYLNFGAGLSTDLLKNIVGNTTQVFNQHSLNITMGGMADAVPRVDFNIPTAHLTVPVTEINDVVGLTIDFTGQGATGLNDTNEMDISYFA